MGTGVGARVGGGAGVGCGAGVGTTDGAPSKASGNEKVAKPLPENELLNL